MTMTHPICLGDPTSSGGVVVECHLGESFSFRGKPFAVMGDKATCPMHLGIYAFTEADQAKEMFGKPVVMQGHRLSCGCRAVARHATSVSVR